MPEAGPFAIRVALAVMQVAEGGTKEKNQEKRGVERFFEEMEGV